MTEPSQNEERASNAEARELRDHFAQLLTDYVAVANRGPARHETLEAGFRDLLEEFGRVRERIERLEHEKAATDHRLISDLLTGYDEASDRYRRQQEQFADDFNVLAVLQLTGDEVRHSMMLAWLLDRDIRKSGTHAQGSLGFQLFLNEVGLPSHYADCKYWVRTEVAGEESIVDVEIGYRRRFLVHIENKIWSPEGIDQTHREWADLQRRAAGLQVSASEVHAFFLTPHGIRAANANFRAISWKKIVNVVTAFADQAKPVDVKLFTRHYATALQRFILVQDRKEGKHGEGTVERS